MPPLRYRGDQAEKQAGPHRPTGQDPDQCSSIADRRQALPLSLLPHPVLRLAPPPALFTLRFGPGLDASPARWPRRSAVDVPSLPPREVWQMLLPIQPAARKRGARKKCRRESASYSPIAVAMTLIDEALLGPNRSSNKSDRRDPHNQRVS
jgi:hypothetical protein